ncbi:MAG: CheY-like chemotaxis protein [Alphaproteobacteria bacterium]|jgi:CheY-like chemotaxis protein
MARILIIDDDDALRAALGAALREEGHVIEEASGGNAGLARCRTVPPDIVITDIVMAEGEGIETIRTLSKTAPHLPIIAISGQGEYLRSALKLGAARVLMKPFRLSQLLAVLAEIAAIEGASF